LKEHDQRANASTNAGRQAPESMADSVESQSHVNWWMLLVAGLISGFGVLVTVPPLVKPSLAPHWAWATPHFALIIVLTLSMLALVGLWHQQRYLGLMRERELTDALGITAYFDPGGLQKQILLGASEVGQDAMTRFYLLHVMVLPLLLAVFAGVHFWRIRKDGGISGPL